ncbi:MAG TPA: hypothetical protein VM760_07210 [Sphingomicrobium sp.]|nr:hypothetical protein [Sphingomicrobium sp.]
MSAIVSGIIGGIAATALGAAALRSQKEAALDADGWRRLRPGWYMHLALGGCILFVLLVAFFFYTGGSARRDADSQNFAALLIMLAFGAGALWTLWAGYLRRVAWRAGDIRISTPLGAQTYRFADVVGVGGNADGSECKLHMSDGSVVRVGVYFHGFQQFIQALGEHLSQRD